MYNTKKRISVLYYFLICVLLFCEEKSNEKSFSKTEFNVETVVRVDYPWNFFLSVSEFIRFNSDITDKKYMELALKEIISFSALELKLKIKYAYLQYTDFFAEAGVGTGWCFEKIPFFGLAGSKNIQGRKEIIPYNFSKALFSFTAGIDLYFDLSDFVQNDWAHLMLKTGQRIKYRHLTLASKTDFWFWQNNLLENRNGALYSASYAAEYAMPLYLNKIVFKLMTERKLYKPLPNTLNKSENLWNFELDFGLCFKPADFIIIELNSAWESSVLYMPNSERIYFTQKKVNKNKKQTMISKNISVAVYFIF